jgi:hypothetical protein
MHYFFKWSLPLRFFSQHFSCISLYHACYLVYQTLIKQLLTV